MDLDRLTQFKRDSEIIIKTSQWLVCEMDKVLDKEEYYEDNPHLDTYQMMKGRLDKMDELQQRSEVQNKIDRDHRKKYKDLYDIDF
jgi:hypothetical protein